MVLYEFRLHQVHLIFSNNPSAHCTSSRKKRCWLLEQPQKLSHIQLLNVCMQLPTTRLPCSKGWQYILSDFLRAKAMWWRSWTRTFYRKTLNLDKMWTLSNIVEKDDPTQRLKTVQSRTAASVTLCMFLDHQGLGYLRCLAGDLLCMLYMQGMHY